MKKIDQLVNLYSVSKTLRFKAIPIGKTQENIEKKRLIEEDEERAQKYKIAKRIIDKYHIDFIDRVLSEVRFDDLQDYIDLFCKKNKDENDKKQLDAFEAGYRKKISESFSNDPVYDKLFKKELLDELLPEYLQDEGEKEIIKSFKGFWTAFTGYNENRENMYGGEEKSTAIAYRCINENLPRFISNLICFEQLRDRIDANVLNDIAENMSLDPYSVSDFFHTDFFWFVLSNTGIATYNCVVGGYVTNDGTKIKGLNEYINLYNQKISKTDKKLPLLKSLYKQILSEQEGRSFYAEGYQSVKELLEDLKNTTGKQGVVQEAIDLLKTVFSEINLYNTEGIYIKNGVGVTDLSNSITGSWSTFRDNWNRNYDEQYMTKIPKNYEQYEEKRRKYYNSLDSFSLDTFSKLLSTDESEYSLNDVIGYYKRIVNEQIIRIKELQTEIEYLFEEEYKEDCLKPDDILHVKEFLDAIKELENLLRPLQGTGKESYRDEVFYGVFTKAMDNLIVIDTLYNRVRNFVTQKPYSTDKLKLYFQNPQFLNGWDINKERDYRSTFLRKDGKYFLAVIDKADSAVLQRDKYQGEQGFYEKMIYKQIQSAAKYLSKKQILPQNPPDEIRDFLEKKNSDPELQERFIKYIAEDFLKNYKPLQNQDGECYFDFAFKDAGEYENTKEFFTDVEQQAYSVKFESISERYINELVDTGAIYLFQLYNKDFSENSHGMENLHTMYFKQIFNADNQGTIKLCGGAEFFYRKASIKEEDRIIHPAGQEIKNKNLLNEKKSSCFEYDLIKDKRYTVDQYEIHLPIILNKNPKGIQRLNDEVRRLLREDDNPYIIGIDRGERNLLYICVIDGQGNIVEQYSLNEIVNQYQGKEIRTDYQQLLSRKEQERVKARQDWKAVENIKELKEGYISQVIHKICELVIKYDAIVAMEDLNSGFKNSRKKVERQVYQKFEKALIDKFNYLADKSREVGQNGSVTKGYQLANSFKSFKSMGTQNGFIFYIPAWLTSKLDPVTGFADLLKPKYTSIADAQNIIRAFDGISYSPSEDMFEFTIDYRKFPRTDADYRKEWKIYTNGTRIRTFRNPQKNSEWDNEEIDLTVAFKEMFSKYMIPYEKGDFREHMCNQSEKQFYVEFIGLLRLTLQMRNSISGNKDVDYLVSPVKDNDGDFFDSRKSKESLPKDADANGAYNIARKALWAIQQFKKAEEKDVPRTKIAISNKEWLEFVQK